MIEQDIFREYLYGMNNNINNFSEMSFLKKIAKTKIGIVRLNLKKADFSKYNHITKYRYCDHINAINTFYANFKQ